VVGEPRVDVARTAFESLKGVRRVRRELRLGQLDFPVRPNAPLDVAVA
jgi:hypothetical protein